MHIKAKQTKTVQIPRNTAQCEALLQHHGLKKLRRRKLKFPTPDISDRKDMSAQSFHFAPKFPLNVDDWTKSFRQVKIFPTREIYEIKFFAMPPSTMTPLN